MHKFLKISIISILINTILIIMKLIIGISFNVLSLVADGLNNISDLLSAIIAYIGLKLSSKPADKEHPYGHRRLETIAAFIISIFMLFLSLEIIQKSISNIWKKEVLVLDRLIIITIIISIVLKFALYLITKIEMNKSDSDILELMKLDSRNDILINLIILVSFFLFYQFGLNLDAYLGLVIAVFIIVSTFKLLIKIMDDLLGRRPRQELINNVIKLVSSNEDVFSYHDLLIHEYGKDTYFGSIHLEVDERLSLNKAHLIADKIEKEVKEKINVNLVVHLDPIDIVSDDVKAYHKLIKTSLHELDKRFTFHDFRIIEDILEFDVVMYEGCEYSEEEVLEKLRSKIDPRYKLDIEFDKVQLTRDLI